MNVGHRINARKIMFSYIYTDFFYREYNAKKNNYISEHDGVFQSNNEIEGMDLKDSDQNKIVGDTFLSELNIQTEDVEVEAEEKFHELFLNRDNSEDFSIIASGLRMDLDEIDWDYITCIRDHYKDYEDEVEKLINPLLSQFQWRDLESIKKAIFILGYTEYKVLGTDVKVIINEAIELAKRFGGSDVYKLVNGVFDKLLLGDKGVE